MPDDRAVPTRPQNAVLENCKRLVLSGIKEVLNFDEQAVSLETDLGRLEIRGNKMHVASFDTATGDMMIDGYIYALVYTKQTQKQGFLKRVFK